MAQIKNEKIQNKMGVLIQALNQHQHVPSNDSKAESQDNNITNKHRYSESHLQLGQVKFHVKTEQLKVKSQVNTCNLEVNTGKCFDPTSHIKNFKVQCGKESRNKIMSQA